MSEPYRLNLATAAQAIADLTLLPSELTESVLDRLDTVEDTVSAYATVTADSARQAAAVADGEIDALGPRSPLHGIPIGVKDLIDTAGIPTASGSLVHAGRVPTADAAVVESVQRAGAVSIGKTHTHEFAAGVRTPGTNNPWSPDRIVGGSSGGSAAAVASGTAIAALGTDTGGSIRIPAALCGVVGLKPTYGLVPTTGVTPLSWSLDHVGPIARTVADAATLLDAMAGHDPRDPASLAVTAENRRRLIGHELTGLRVGVPTEFFFDRVVDEVRDAVAAAIVALVDLGAIPVEVPIPMAHYAQAIRVGVLFPEAAELHRRSLRDSAAKYGDDVRTVLEAATLLPATDYLRAQRARRLLHHGWLEMFADIDVLATPTTPITAVPAEQDEVRWPDGSTETVTDALLRFTEPANLTGMPALTLPVGQDSAGLPIGMQLIGRPMEESRLIQVGAALEHAKGSAGTLAPL
ncbi:Asp-tRNA(Asn)/Glu-tRNA(Gln) amidotransferase GatCAB subunit A [Actinoalloteichus hymeniacidonis]|uniref:Amidase, Asp-tRNAAsn/Glu-tRNAGln amidotransferase A subunit n=1 Tax=Actinoalloteichus hymeniacidonis TaxID=340345 RepID=A0AAC9MZC0_9PSEU|nr:Asp-tRNA(Asn)/Glu-tRNA(Gln) amidotransferase GatCAB subunit A [Actinoalloteichus hymeniacidonis]AOS64200.1 amidase, Asp-tRNAAsn/Glu-tRNAGln amidotransferase A subunit [Actinoalloteichus hymeniacidonis]MBB5907732.1 aspartyl-tRNA(Asn)/glutamyl-tRNA(Gln) amidotransferase subunit A [Actinoalloteichus hymeniacidonis]